MATQYRKDWMRRRCELLAQEAGCDPERCYYESGSKLYGRMYRFVFNKAGSQYYIQGRTAAELVNASEAFRVALALAAATR